MSTPLFVRQPVIGAKTAVAAIFEGAEAWTAILGEQAEPVLVEAVHWCAEEVSTAEGMINLALLDGDDNAYRIGSTLVPAGSATRLASGVIAVGITLPPGWRLAAQHTLMIAGPALGHASFVARSGIVR